MARQPSPGQYQRLNEWESFEDPSQREAANQNTQSHIAELKLETAQIPEDASKGDEQEQSKSPGWTWRGGMEPQQLSAIEYNAWVNERHADHNAELMNSREQSVAPEADVSQDPQQTDHPDPEELRRALELMEAANARLEQTQDLENEKVIGD